jgi:transcriptional regulator with XRE-family HTH domain
MNWLMENNFNDWVMSEMEKRNWSFADLSKKSGISQAHISKVFSGQRGIGNDFLNAISIALGYPPEYIFRKSGNLATPSRDYRTTSGIDLSL